MTKELIPNTSALNLDECAELCHKLAFEAGWWPKERDIETRASKIALIHSEVSEMLEGLRKDCPDTHLPSRRMEEVECVDVLIRIFDYAGERKFQLVDAFHEKLQYNTLRHDHKQSARSMSGGKKI